MVRQLIAVMPGQEKKVPVSCYKVKSLLLQAVFHVKMTIYFHIIML